MQRWFSDFTQDQLADSRSIHVRKIADELSRVCPGQIVDTSISGARLARLVAVKRDKPGHQHRQVNGAGCSLHRGPNPSKRLNRA